MRDLYSEYTQGAPDLLEFYPNAPRSLFESKPEPVAWHQKLREALQGMPERGVAIVTGQQPGLFTGPLYTVYKACTAVILARRLEERWSVPCVPVFWLGADDHDFEETRSAFVLDKDHRPLELRYEPAQPVDGLPMFEVPLEDSLHALIDRAATETPGSEFREPMADLLHDTLNESRTLAEWTGRLMEYLFRDTPLRLFSPNSDVSRQLAVPVLEREIDEPLRSTTLLNEAGARLQSLGFAQQVIKAPDECNFFLFVERRRRKVIFRDGRYLVPEERLNLSPAELQTLLRDDPHRFSPNVALRCVVQQRIFGAAAYIGGPGEIAYWAQLKPVFEHFGLPMATVYPRTQCTLTTIKLNKLMTRYGLSLTDLTQPTDAVVERALRRTSDSKSRQELQRLREPVEAALRSLAEGLSDPNAHAMAESLREGVGENLNRIERAIVLRDRAQVDAVTRQVERLCNSLAPWRKPQERVYTVFSYLFEQGPGLIQRLVDGLDITSFQMNEVEL